MEVKKIILHTDWNDIYIENHFANRSLIHVPTLIGETQSLIPKEFNLDKRIERIINHSLFNQSRIAEINLPLGNNGLYYLILRNDYMLQNVVTEPKSLVQNIFTNENKDPKYKGFIYSFYNNTGISNIRVMAELVEMNYSYYNQLKANGNRLDVRVFLLERMKINLDNYPDADTTISFIESFDKNGISWEVKVVTKDKSGTIQEFTAPFSNTLPMFCIIFLAFFFLNSSRDMKTDVLYNLSKKFTEDKNINSNSDKARRNITSAFSDFFIAKKKDNEEKKAILKVLEKIYKNSITISLPYSRFSHLRSVKINITSNSIKNLVSDIAN